MITLQWGGRLILMIIRRGKNGRTISYGIIDCNMDSCKGGIPCDI